jgi:hypothetical protein
MLLPACLRAPGLVLLVVLALVRQLDLDVLDLACAPVLARGILLHLMALLAGVRSVLPALHAVPLVLHSGLTRGTAASRRTLMRDVLVGRVLLVARTTTRCLPGEGLLAFHQRLQVGNQGFHYGGRVYSRQ